jgi:DNA-binding transcriptional MerR regulator
VSADSAARDTGLLSIGEVLAQLRAEFPDTTISKLRFLETEGLVQPQRTPSGYRKYSREDVARLRYVLAAQRDQYLPLRVIRQQLDNGAHMPPPSRPTLVAVKDDFVEGPVAEPAAARPPETKVHREELCGRAGVSPQLIADLERHGLLTATGGDWFDAEAVTVAEVAGRLSEYGIEARHLRGARVAADREAGLLAQVVAPLLGRQSGARDGGERELVSRARADEAIRELILLSQRLHLALLRQGLNETLGH